MNVDTVCDLTRDVPESLHSFQSSNSLWFADFIQKFELVVVCGSACTPASSFNFKETPRQRFGLQANDFWIKMVSKTFPGAPQMPPKDLRGPPSGPSGDPRGAGEVLSARIPHFSIRKPLFPGASLNTSPPPAPGP